MEQRNKRILFCTRFSWATVIVSPHPSFLSSFSLVPFSFPLPLFSSSCSPLRPCWIGGVNTGREQALFHHAGAEPGRSCSAAAPGSKVYRGFHFTFPQPITAPTLQRLNSGPGKEFHSKDGLTPVSQLRPLPAPRSLLPVLLLFFSFNWPVSCVDRA